MLNLALNGGILSGIWDAIKSVVQFFSSFIDILKGLFQALTVYIFSVFYYLHMGICSIVNFSEMLFKKFAGLDPIMSADGPVNILDVFVKSNEIWGLFIAILVLSIVLLLLFTLVAIIKSEFALDVKGSAKGPIVARSLKSLAMFIIVPVVSLMGIYAVNAITNTINDMMKGGSNTGMVNQIFYTMSYNANKARINKEFADHIRGFSERKDGSYRNDNAGYFKGSQDDIAYQIDMAFKGNEGHRAAGYKALNIFDDMIPAEDFSTLLMPVSMANLVDTYSVWDIVQVNYYFSLMEIDYIIGLGSAIVISYLLLSMCVVLVKRIFEIVILLLLAAPMIALAPLDGGSASKSWQKEFIKRVISIVAPVFAINMYFIMIPLFMNITIFGGGINSLAQVGAISLSNTGSFMAVYATYDAIFQLLAICVGMSVVKTASALLCNLLGIEDLVKSGQEATKKAVGTAVQVAAMASGVGGGVMALAKGGMAAVKGAASAGKGNRLAGLKSGWASTQQERGHAMELLKDKTVGSDLVKNSAFGQLLDKSTYKNMGKTNKEIDAEKRKKEKEKDLRASEAAAESVDKEDGVKDPTTGKRSGGQKSLKKEYETQIALAFQEKVKPIEAQLGVNGDFSKKKVDDATDDYEKKKKRLDSMLEGKTEEEQTRIKGTSEYDKLSREVFAAEDEMKRLKEGRADLQSQYSAAVHERENAYAGVRNQDGTYWKGEDGVVRFKSQESADQEKAAEAAEREKFLRPERAEGTADHPVSEKFHESKVGQVVDKLAGVVGTVAQMTAKKVDEVKTSEFGQKVGDVVQGVGDVVGTSGAQQRAMEGTENSAATKAKAALSTETAKMEGVVSSKNDGDNMSDAVEKGVKEASSDLARQIKDALQSGKIGVEGMSQLRAAMEVFNKQFMTAQKNDTTGQEMIAALAEMSKKLEELKK